MNCNELTGELVNLLAAERSERVELKDRVEALQYHIKVMEAELTALRRDANPPRQQTFYTDENALETIRMIRDGSHNKISMIKAFRSMTGAGLKEAKDAIEARFF